MKFWFKEIDYQYWPSWMKAALTAFAVLLLLVGSIADISL